MNDYMFPVRSGVGKRFRLLAAVLGLSMMITLMTGCVTRSITPPRSEIIEEAKENGLEIPSIEEDKERFYAWEQQNQDRLLKIIEGRLDGDAIDSSYRIGPGDELEIQVFDVEEMNSVVRVSQSGFIELPLINGVQASGLTAQQLEGKLRGRLSRFVRNPQASVYITEYASQEVAVVGAVMKPDRYPLRKGSNSLMELITVAGGMSPGAGNTVNFVPVEYTGIQGLTTPEERARFALKASSAQKKNALANSNQALEVAVEDVFGTSGGIPLEIPVRGGDMIIIPEAGKVLVEGEVEVRGSFPIGKRATLLGVLATAGGITYSAKIDEIELVRPTRSGEKLRLVLSLEEMMNGMQDDVPVRAGDLIRVPSNRGRRLTEDTFESISRIVNVGVGSQVQVIN